MVLIRGMKLSSGKGLVLWGCRNRPETVVESGLRRRVKKWLVMIESQCLDTDLKILRDLMGRRIRISIKRSELAATFSAADDNDDDDDDDDEYSAMEEVCDTSPVSSPPGYRQRERERIVWH